MLFTHLLESITCHNLLELRMVIKSSNFARYSDIETNVPDTLEHGQATNFLSFCLTFTCPLKSISWLFIAGTVHLESMTLRGELKMKDEGPVL